MGLFSRSAKAKSEATIETAPVFDKKFKTIVKLLCTPKFIEIIDWVDKNSSGAIDVQFGIGTNNGLDTMYVGFEDEADALIFKIRYL